MFRTAPAALLLCFCATLSPAAVWTGGGGDNLWSSAANWDTLSVPDTEAFAVFPASESTTAVTLDASATIAGIAATNSVSLSGEALHLTAPEPVRAASGVTLNFSNPVSLTAETATLSAYGAILIISSNACTAAGPVSASIRTLSVRDGALLTPGLTLFGNANYYAWQPTLSVQGTAPDGLTGRLVSGMNLLDGGQGWNLSIDGGSETLGALSFGFAAPHAVNLTSGAALEVAAFRAQPGGLLRLSLADGASLSDVQNRLRAEYGLHPTFFDVRMLVMDIGAQVKDKEAQVDADDVTKAKLPPKPGADAEPPPAPGTVSITVDTIQAIPGALVSGSVVFSDGEKARWYFDQMGRFGFEPDLPGYQPSPEDSRAFQTQLQTALSQRGY